VLCRFVRVVVYDGGDACREVAEEIHEERGPCIRSGEGGEVVGFLRPVARVGGWSVGWRDPVRVSRNIRLRAGTSGTLFSPESAGKCNVDLKTNVS
jgi:hypothetical protein